MNCVEPFARGPGGRVRRGKPGSNTAGTATIGEEGLLSLVEWYNIKMSDAILSGKAPTFWPSCFPWPMAVGWTAPKPVWWDLSGLGSYPPSNLLSFLQSLLDAPSRPPWFPNDWPWPLEPGWTPADNWKIPEDWVCPAPPAPPAPSAPSARAPAPVPAPLIAEKVRWYTWLALAAVVALLAVITAVVAMRLAARK